MKKILAILAMCLMAMPAFSQKVSQRYIPDKSKPVLLIFTADWCAPCQAMKQNVFTLPDVAAALSQYNVLMVDVDTPLGATYQERFCKKEVQIPYFVVLDRNGVVRNRKLGAMQAGVFLDFLRDSGTLAENASSLGGVKYIDVPDKNDFDKGWGFETAAGGALTTSTDTSAYLPGIELAFNARYRASKLVALKTGLEATITPAASKYVPSASVLVPLDLELYLAKTVYASAGTFVAAHKTAKAGLCADFGFRAGAGVRIKNFDVRIGYNLGALNLNKGDIVNRVTARSATLTVGYCF